MSDQFSDLHSSSFRFRPRPGPSFVSKAFVAVVLIAIVGLLGFIAWFPVHQARKAELQARRSEIQRDLDEAYRMAQEADGVIQMQANSLKEFTSRPGALEAHEKLKSTRRDVERTIQLLQRELAALR